MIGTKTKHQLSKIRETKILPSTHVPDEVLEQFLLDIINKEIFKGVLRLHVHGYESLFKGGEGQVISLDSILRKDVPSHRNTQGK